MKVLQLNIGRNTRNPAQKQSFKGTPHELPQIEIRDWHDAIKAWECLRFARYSDVHSDKFDSYNKSIRKDNYSFLDKLESHYDKAKFIEELA